MVGEPRLTAAEDTMVVTEKEAEVFSLKMRTADQVQKVGPMKFQYFCLKSDFFFDGIQCEECGKTGIDVSAELFV